MIIGNSSENTITANNIEDPNYYIYARAGNDSISVSDSRGLILSSGAGADTLSFSGGVQAVVTDFSLEDTLVLHDPVSSAQYLHGVLTMGNVSLTLADVEDIYTFNSLSVISGSSETTLGTLLESGFSWIVESGTATYGNLITLSGLSENATASDIVLAGTTVTISNNALNSSNTVTVTEGYSLALDSDVTISEITSAEWKIEDTFATYIAGGRTAGYTINNNEIEYTPASSETTLATLSGLSKTVAAEDLIVSETVITITENALDSTKTVTLTGAYTLALAEDVSVPFATATDWYIENGVGNYNAAGMTGGFVISGNSISYQDPTSVTTLITVTGLSATATSSDLSVNDKNVTVSANALSTEPVVITEGYTLSLSPDVPTPVSYSTTWTVNRGVATYKAAHKTAGYVWRRRFIILILCRNLLTRASLNSFTGLTMNAATEFGNWQVPLPILPDSLTL